MSDAKPMSAAAKRAAARRARILAKGESRMSYVTAGRGTHFNFERSASVQGFISGAAHVNFAVLARRQSRGDRYRGAAKDRRVRFSGACPCASYPCASAETKRPSPSCRGFRIWG